MSSSATLFAVTAEGMRHMTIAKVLKKAEKAHSTYLQAMKTAEKAASERERALREAVPQIASIYHATKVLCLSDDNDRKVFAWKKAITLLGTNGKSTEHLVLLMKNEPRLTQKDSDFIFDLERKKKLILSSASDEQLDCLYEAFPNEFKEKLRKRLEGKAELCQTEEQLNALKTKAEALGFYYLFDSWNDKHRLRVLGNKVN